MTEPGHFGGHFEEVMQDLQCDFLSQGCVYITVTMLCYCYACMAVMYIPYLRYNLPDKLEQFIRSWGNGRQNWEELVEGILFVSH